MLPNVFAAVTCLHAYAAWVQNQVPYAAMWIIVTTAVFRCDCLLLLFTAGLSWIFVQRQLTLTAAIRLGLVTGLLTLLLTVPLDSLLWQRPLWPEGEVLFFNTILNKSSEWGVSAWHFYISSALPKAMMSSLLLVPLSFLRIPELLAMGEKRLLRQRGAPHNLTNQWPAWKMLDTQWLPVLVPAFGFVFLYSFLGHKETRFLFPVLPLFNLAAAIGLDRILRLAFPPDGKEKSGSILCRVGAVGVLVLLLLTWFSSLFFVAVSHYNYPGGNALASLAQHVDQATFSAEHQVMPAVVHVDVASAMSGVSLFGQRSASRHGHGRVAWKFDKAGYEDENMAGSSGSWTSFSHLLTEERSLGGSAFEEVAVIPGNPYLDWRQARIVVGDAIFVRERIGWSAAGEQ